MQKMKDENKDHYDIKKFAEVLEESEMMIPDSENRLKKIGCIDGNGANEPTEMGGCHRHSLLQFFSN